MKTLLAMALVIFTLSACNKDDNNQANTELNSYYSGKWELAQKTGLVIQSYPAGNANYITLLADGTFKRSQHDTLTFSGTYSLRPVYDDCSKQNIVVFYSNDNTLNGYAIAIQDNQLTFRESYCIADATGYTYRRIE